MSSPLYSDLISTVLRFLTCSGAFSSYRSTTWRTKNSHSAPENTDPGLSTSRLKMETPSVRVLVVGDSGVGKTALLRSICRSHWTSSSSIDKPSTLWTTGCDVHVLLTSLGPAGREVFVEFLDVGGHRQYELSRGAFYHDVHGVMFIHDLSNVKSGEHLRNWSRELNTIQRLKGCVVPSSGKDHDFPTLHELPKLVVGNKKDLLSRNYRSKTTGPMGFSEFRTVPCIESSAEPLSMEPSGVFEAFLQQTV
ncbi:Ras-like protein, partial [Phytophthora palmivora]